MDRLPEACLLEIIQFLSPVDMKNLMIASKKVYVLFSKCRGIFKTLDFSELEERMDHIPTMNVWHNVRHVRFLGLRCCNGVMDFSAIATMPSLLVVDFYGTQVRDHDLCSMPQKLLGVDIGFCANITMAGVLTFVRNQCNLKDVGFAGLGKAISNKVIEVMNSDGLRYLDLSECNVSLDIVQHSLNGKLMQLSELSLQGTDRLRQIWCFLKSNMPHLNTLRVLEIGPSRPLVTLEEEIVDDILNIIPSLGNLQILSLIKCAKNTKNTNDNFLHQICHPLKICLWRCHITLIEYVQSLSRSSNPNITYRITPLSQLSSVLYMS